MGTLARHFKEQGIAEGRIEGIAEGKVKGIAEGRVEGIAKGTIAAKIEIANIMLKKGIDLNLIHEVTKLSIAEIKQLQENLI